MAYRAVIFDLGGVVFPSPFDVFDAYERDAGLPPRFIRTVVAASAEDGAWARFERSELSFADFCAALEAECAAAGGTIDAAALMQGIGAGFAPRPEMIRARSGGCATQACGSARSPTTGPDPTPRTLRGPSDLGFHIVVESAVEGIRKPDPRIYALVCERLDVTPDVCVFLDDLGVNLKPARAMGMTTIKVVDPTDALVELGGHLDLELVGL